MIQFYSNYKGRKIIPKAWFDLYFMDEYDCAVCVYIPMLLSYYIWMNAQIHEHIFIWTGLVYGTMNMC